MRSQVIKWPVISEKNGEFMRRNGEMGLGEGGGGTLIMRYLLTLAILRLENRSLFFPLGSRCSRKNSWILVL